MATMLPLAMLVMLAGMPLTATTASAVKPEPVMVMEVPMLPTVGVTEAREKPMKALRIAPVLVS
ncbi:hypothetical protein D3C86_2235850 [compost metagenome]